VELGKDAGDLGALGWIAVVAELTGSSRDERKERNGVARPDPANRLTSRRRQRGDDEVQPAFVTKTECSVEGISEAVERCPRCVAQPFLLAQVVDCHEEAPAGGVRHEPVIAAESDGEVVGRSGFDAPAFGERGKEPSVVEVVRRRFH